MLKRAYVTAFAGRRDSYQVPLALFEHGRLQKFITDAYDKGSVAKLIKAGGGSHLVTRRCNGLPDGFVDAHFGYEVGARALRRIMEPSRGGVIADGWFARAAAAAANAKGASALLYEFQAEEGFRGLSGPSQRRMLFHFHPHPGWEHPILADDARAHPEFSGLVASQTRSNLPARYSDHTRGAWKSADHVIVASTCTRSSLLHVGCPPERISVVPYGRETVEQEGEMAQEPHEPRPYLLWVGSGTPRKGLHHLCQAWAASGACKSSTLIVVARALDPGMEPYLQREGIRWVKGLPRAELNWYFRNARAFVMPSLSEGFGQVYLEALASGCPVIGTRNSVLPDLPNSQAWIRYAEPGNIEALSVLIEEAAVGSGPTDATRKEIAASVSGFTWERFRLGIESVLSRFD
jgi:glycosyltransferase involved in cell wall biosynthesis